MDAIRSRDWCFTVNNYTEANVKTVCEVCSAAKYGIYGEETAKTGTHHLQGYIYFVNAKSFSKMRKLLPDGAHIEVTRGTPLQASEYCKKEGKFREFGTLPEKQGKRTDLDNVRDTLADTGRIRDVVAVAQSYQSIRMAEVHLKYFEVKRTWKPHVSWYYGDTGTGKTKAAYEELGLECYTCMQTGKWFEGYDAHENVLIDDFRYTFMEFNEFLKLLDRYAFQVQCKGGSRQFLAKRIIITSPMHPSLAYCVDENINQLLRRIDVIKEFK